MRLLNFWLVSAAIASVGAQGVGSKTGIDRSTGERPARRNINDVFAEGGPMWDLYVQGLLSLQETNESEWLSYYQIMGIHGLPFTGWNGVEQVPGGGDTGFCPHGQLNFGTWHRPYVALYEQALAQHVQRIANNYTGPQSTTYKAAGSNFRIAYWDWADTPDLPPVTSQPTLAINTARGRATVRNPFYSYVFHPYPFKDPNFSGDLARYSESKRCANRKGVEDFPSSNGMLENDGETLRDAVYGVFTQSQTFEEMTTSGGPGPSFEDPHNLVHNDVSCWGTAHRWGHMVDLHWSAFDPMFMLHHTNVDRLMAMWQAIHYNNSMFTSTRDGESLYGIAEGPVTPDSPLKPFKDPNGNFYTSKTVAQIKTFGYTYPEIRDWKYSGDELSRAVIQQVNLLYGTSTAVAGGSTRRWKSSRIAKRSSVEAASRDDVPETSYAPQAPRDYTIDIKVEREELPLPVSIDIYLKDRRVGRTAVLGMPKKGSFHSTIQMRRRLHNSNVKMENTHDVVSLLQEGVRVEIRKSDGSLVPVESVPSLEMNVQDRDFVQRTSDFELPRFGDVQRHSVKLTNPKGYGS